MTRFQSFSVFFHHFVLAKLANSSITVSHSKGWFENCGPKRVLGCLCASVTCEIGKN